MRHYLKTLNAIVNLVFPLGYWLLVAIFTLRILVKRRAAAATITWLLIIYTLPLVGMVVYLFFGELRLGRLKANRAKSLWPAFSDWFSQLRIHQGGVRYPVGSEATPLFKLCERRQNIPPLSGNRFTIKTTPDEIFQSLIADIRAARNCIDIVFYIWQPGGWVDLVVGELLAAVRRGVRCRLLLDSAGSLEFFRSSYPATMRAAGIRLVEALPVNPLRMFFQRADLRQHRKMVLIDHQIGYTGSMNMVDPLFFEPENGVGVWVDLMVRIEGITTLALGSIFAWDWEVETGEHLLPPLPSSRSILRSGSDVPAQLVASGPNFPKEIIQQALLTAIYGARQRLTMTTPYFVPSDDLLLAIVIAAQRGVQVDLVLPKYNHSVMVRWASSSFFQPLLDAGVNIYQFESGFLHTKSILVDNRLSLVGTANLDMRSLWLNFEITLIIDDPLFGSKFAELHQEYIINSVPLDLNEWAKRPLYYRIIERIFYFFSPLL